MVVPRPDLKLLVCLGVITKETKHIKQPVTPAFWFIFNCVRYSPACKGLKVPDNVAEVCLACLPNSMDMVRHDDISADLQCLILPAKFEAIKDYVTVPLPRKNIHPAHDGKSKEMKSTLVPDFISFSKFVGQNILFFLQYKGMVGEIRVGCEITSILEFFS